MNDGRLDYEQIFMKLNCINKSGCKHIFMRNVEETFIMTPTFLGWAGLVFILCLATFGPYGCLLMLVCLVVCIISIVTTLFVFGQDWTEEYWNKASISRLELPSNGIPSVKSRLLSSEKFNRFDKRLTGSSIIDEHLQEVLQFALRDYVLLWYRKISDDERFPQCLQESAQQVIISLAKKVKDVDWIQFLTIQLVEDFASHFRLFREAQHKLCEKKKIDVKTTENVVSIFFELENEMHGNMHWSGICKSSEEEKVYLRDLIEVLLYLLLPLEDFNNKTFRYLTRELLVNTIFLPTVSLLSDPDYINQTVVWLCKDVSVTSEGFITVLRLTNSADELSAVQENLNHEIAIQRSKDSGGDDDAVIKQQLSSLLFVKRVVDHRLQRLQEGVDTDSAGLPTRFDWKKVMSAGYKLYSLPLDVVLKNNIALSYFIDFMMCTGHQAYMFFYLTVEGYRVSAEQQISQAQLDQLANSNTNVSKLEALREAALNIYEQYLSLKAMPRIKLDELLLNRVYQRIQTETPTENWFDEVQLKVLEILSEEKYFGTFKKSPQYIKMLAELDLLKDTSKSDEDDMQSLDELQRANSDSISMSSQEEALSDSAYASMSTLNLKPSKLANAVVEGLTVKAKIVGTGLIKDAKPYIVYAVEVIKSIALGKEDKWQVYRRYSDFHDFHTTAVAKCFGLNGHNFPGKKTFNNMNPEFLGKRMQQLNDYLQFLLNAETCEKYPSLQELVLNFLEPVPYSRGKGRFTRKVNRVVNPIRESVRNVGNMVRAVPDNFIQTVDCVMDGLCRALHGKNPGEAENSGFQDSLRMTAGLDFENDEDIPLRILLVLVDEVFDLKSRNQWLRRRIVVLLREFIKTMYGDRINRKILDYVVWLTSSEQIAEYVKAFRNAVWPNGFSAQHLPLRDENTRLRTRVAAKMAILCFLPDEMKHIIGSETTRKGVHLLFEMFQQPELNRRLLYELLEKVLKLIFPNNDIPAVLRKLHSTNSTVQGGQQSSDSR